MMPRRNSPAFAAYQNEHHMDRQNLLAAWDLYIEIWSNPDLMDKLRDNDYPVEAFLESDKQFAARIAE